MGDVTSVRVEQVPAELTYPLRHRVLRSHEPLSALRLRGDDAPLTGTFAALTPDGEVVGTATVRPVPCPWFPDESGAWRLRGMATAPELRGLGIGTQLLRAVIKHVTQHDGRLIWCNARTPALNLYLREGFRTEGEEWIDPDIGPHIAMWRPVARPS
jgi:GNAT superfamily N-acetyltransferase